MWRRLRRGVLVLSLVVLPVASVGPSAQADIVTDSPRCDIDGNGYDDAIIGVPGEGLGDIEGAGAVLVLFGDAEGLQTANAASLTQNSPGVVGGAEAFDGFGSATACGDVNNDGKDEVIVGAPDEGLADISRAGVVHVFTWQGHEAPWSSVTFSQFAAGIAGDPEFDDSFGYSLAVGDIDDDGIDDLVVGAPGETVDGIVGAGAVYVLFGKDGNLKLGAGSVVVTQNSPGVPGGAEAYDGFGYALDAKRIDDDPFDDIVVGVPHEDIGAEEDAGAAYVLSGGSAFTGSTAEIIHQNSPGVGGSAEANDNFGYSVAAGEGGPENPGFVAIGAPGEAFGDEPSVGVVWISEKIEGSAQYGRVIHQNSPGIVGVAEGGDAFGSAVYVLEQDGSVADLLVISAPGEGLGPLLDAGAIHIIARNQDGNFGPNTALHQNSPGVPGGAEPGDRFGETLGGAGYELLVGAPFESLGEVAVAAGVVQTFMTVADVVPRLTLTQNSPGIPGGAEANDRFGGSLDTRSVGAT